MATSDFQKKFVNLEAVKISYRRKDDSIHLTSADPDVQAGGFHLTLGRGTQTEETLRDLLIEHGVIQSVTSSEVASLVQEASPLEHASTDLGKILVVASPKGGMGKTSVTVLLATLLAKRGRKSNGEPLRVCVVDMDLRDGQIGYIIGERRPTVIQALVINDLEGSLAYSESLGFHSLLAPKRAINADQIPDGFYTTTLSELREKFDVVLVDTAVNTLDKRSGEAFEAADRIVLLTQFLEYIIEATQRWSKDANLSEAAASKTVGLVTNRLEFARFKLGLLQEKLAPLPLVGSIPASRAVMEAFNGGDIAELVLTHSEVSRSVAELAGVLLPEITIDKLPSKR
jgi:cellulose biosynthesis protein BcsQ